MTFEEKLKEMLAEAEGEAERETSPEFKSYLKGRAGALKTTLIVYESWIEENS